MSETTETTNKPISLAVVTGIAPKVGIGIGRRFDITPRGLVFHGEMSLEQYEDTLRCLRLVKESYELSLASAVKYGIQHWGIEKVDQLFIDLDFSHQDATRALAIGQMDLDFKDRPQLEAEHLWVLARCFPKDSAAQAKWAAASEKHNLTAIELQRSIEAGKIVKLNQLQNSSGHGSGGLGYLRALEATFEQWERRLGGHQAILNLKPELKREFLESVKPIEALIREVRVSLGEEV